MSSNPVHSESRPLRVLHLVGRESHTSHVERSALRALLAGIPRRTVEPEVIRFVREDVQTLALRLTGVPVHELALSSRGFSPFALSELSRIALQVRPDIVHAWDHSAQLASVMLQAQSDRSTRLVWSMSSTEPPRRGLIDQARLQALLKFAHTADAIVYSSATAAAAHHDAGFPLERRRIVAPGIPVDLYKPDFAARRSLREALGIPAHAFVVGMYAPFSPHIDHASLIAAAAQFMRGRPDVHCLLGGSSVDSNNAALASLMSPMRTAPGRAHLLGDTTDMATLFSACDVVCLTTAGDSARLDLAAAMLCGVSCVATGVGAQRELLGDFGIGVAPRSVQGLIAALESILQMPADERAARAQRARQHAMRNYTVIQTVSRYRRLYLKLTGMASGGRRPARENTAALSDPAVIVAPPHD